MLTNICLQKKKILYFVFDEKGFPKKKKKKKSKLIVFYIHNT